METTKGARENKGFALPSVTGNPPFIILKIIKSR
jgi:hypothetical protein